MTHSRTSQPIEERLPEFGVSVFESHHADDFWMSFRSHRFAKIIYVLDGSGQLATPTQAKPFQTGDVMVVPPRFRHRIIDAPEEPSSLYVTCVSTRLLAFDRSIVLRLRFTVLADPHLTTRVAVAMRRMVYRQQSDAPGISLPMVADALRLVEWVTAPKPLKRRTVSRGMTPDQNAMRRYVGQLEHQFFEATTIDAAAADLGMSRRHFTKLFAEQTGSTWLNFVRGKAIEHAKKRLRDSRSSIASVAFECGFQDLTTFYRQFKRIVGVSPAKYRAGKESI